MPEENQHLDSNGSKTPMKIQVSLANFKHNILYKIVYYAMLMWLNDFVLILTYSTKLLGLCLYIQVKQWLHSDLWLVSYAYLINPWL